MELGAFKNLLGSLSQFAAPLRNENASLSPEQTAALEKTMQKIITFTESNHLNFGAQENLDLDTLTTLTEKATKAFTQASKIETLERQCPRLARAIYAIEKALKQEKDVRSKTLLLSLFKSIGPANEAFYTLLLKSPANTDLFKDPDFLFKISAFIAVRNPAFFCENLDLFPLQDEHALLQLGGLLKNEDHQALFARYSKLDLKILKAKRAELAKNTKNFMHKFLGLNGLCFGYTLALISLLSFKPHAAVDQHELFRQARFIQQSYMLNSYSSRPADAKQIGIRLLADAKALEKFPTILKKAASVLGFQTAEALIKAAKASDNLSSLIGGIVAKAQSDILLQLTSKQIKKTALNLAGNAKETLIVAAEILILQRERFHLNILLNSIVPPELPPAAKDHYENIPAPIVRNLKLKQEKPLLENIPLYEFVSSLTTLKEPKGHLGLRLLGYKDHHSVYLSFETLSFCDTNDIDLITQQPILRGPFQNSESMTQALYQHLLLTYEGENNYHSFSLFPYAKR